MLDPMPHRTPNVKYNRYRSFTNEDNINARAPNDPPIIATILQPTRSHIVEVMGQNRNIKPRPIENTHAEMKNK